MTGNGTARTRGERYLRTEDLRRHLNDLWSRTYEGALSRAERERVYARAVELLSPVVTAVFDETNEVFLERTGEVAFEGPADDGAGGSIARWSLSWPLQRQAVRASDGGQLEPITVIARLSVSHLHGHLSGSRAGDWPLQVLNVEDAWRQAPVIGAIGEAELHQRIFDVGAGKTWQIVPSFVRSVQRREGKR